MKRKRKSANNYFAVALVCVLLGVLIWAATTCNNTLGGDFGQVFGDSQSRSEGGDFAYIGNRVTKQYWPNEPKYVKQVPKGKRAYFDAEWLRTPAGKGYSPGPR